LRSLLVLSTADTDLLAIRGASNALPADFGGIDARNPARIDPQAMEALGKGVAAGAFWAVCVRLF